MEILVVVKQAGQDYAHRGTRKHMLKEASFQKCERKLDVKMQRYYSV